MTALDPTRRPEGRTIDANGIRTRYFEDGEGEPVVLVHGGGPGADGFGNWQGCFDAFASCFRAIVVDMVGFGRTDRPDPARFVYSQDARTHHMIGFIEALGLSRVSLVGNSMGGCTALGVAMKRPDLVRKLVLMGSAGIKTDEVPAALGPLMQYDGTAEGMRKVVRVLTHRDFEVDDAMVRYRVELSNEPARRAALRAAMEWVRERHGLYYEDDDIRSVTTPTLVIAGKDDPIVTLAQNFRFLELLESSRGYFIPHCGHWVMIEHPQEFAEVTTRFLAS
jgi:2-hydroxy-6-oxo-6-(2'-aminophenyl)hexa-2,4-dienoate hydrolase